MPGTMEGKRHHDLKAEIETSLTKVIPTILKAITSLVFVLIVTCERYRSIVLETDHTRRLVAFYNIITLVKEV